MKLLEHKNIPAFYASYESANYVQDNGKVYEVAAIVMEYMPNGDLNNYITATGGLSEEVARTLFRTLIESKYLPWKLHI